MKELLHTGQLGKCRLPKQKAEYWTGAPMGTTVAEEGSVSLGIHKVPARKILHGKFQDETKGWECPGNGLAMTSKTLEGGAYNVFKYKHPWLFAFSKSRNHKLRGLCVEGDAK